MRHPEQSTANADEGVTYVIEFEPKEGAAADLEAAIGEWMTPVAFGEGHVGIGLFRPCPPHRSCFRVVCQFDDAAKQQSWAASDAHKALMTTTSAFSEGAPKSHVTPGIETWFRLASADPRAPMPTRFKMTVVMFLSMFPFGYALHHALKFFPELMELPGIVNAAVITACVTVLTMYVGMPILTRVLRGWLYPKGNEM